MAGELVPLVMIPRFTTLVGKVGESLAYPGYKTIGLEVSAFELATLNCWRGPIFGGGTPDPTMKIYFEESSDQENWTVCGSASGTGNTIGVETETQVSPGFSKRWFRVRIVLTGDAPVVTCWVVGFLQERES